MTAVHGAIAFLAGAAWAEPARSVGLQESLHKLPTRRRKPKRDGVVPGFNATTAIDERSSLFLRYKGDISGAGNTHAGTVGGRMTW